jgi:hypothetical protein
VPQPGFAEVAGREDVGEEEHERHQPPRTVRRRKHDQAAHKKRCAFELQPASRRTGHRAIGRRGRDFDLTRRPHFWAPDRGRHVSERGTVSAALDTVRNLAHEPQYRSRRDFRLL